jgi:competence protein ComEC
MISLWVPVMLGGGIAAWFVLPDPVTWCAAALLVAAHHLAARTLDARGCGG